MNMRGRLSTEAMNVQDRIAQSFWEIYEQRELVSTRKNRQKNRQQINPSSVPKGARFSRIESQLIELSQKLLASLTSSSNSFPTKNVPGTAHSTHTHIKLMWRNFLTSTVRLKAVQ